MLNSGSFQVPLNTLTKQSHLSSQQDKATKDFQMIEDVFSAPNCECPKSAGSRFLYLYIKESK